MKARNCTPAAATTGSDTSFSKTTANGWRGLPRRPAALPDWKNSEGSPGLFTTAIRRRQDGRMSLALDIMEELRPALADRFVLMVINRGIAGPEGFVVEESGAVVMTDETRATMIRKWQERKQEELTHPFLKEKIQWGLVPYAQALLLARRIRGDIGQYPPFFWK